MGVETRGDRDIPYWPASNFPNWKEVWVHPVARWIAIVSDLESLAARPRMNDVSLTAERRADGTLLIRAASRSGREIELRTWNLATTRRRNAPGSAGGASEYTAKIVSPDRPWIAVAIPEGQPESHQEIVGGFR